LKGAEGEGKEKEKKERETEARAEEKRMVEERERGKDVGGAPFVMVVRPTLVNPRLPQ